MSVKDGCKYVVIQNEITGEVNQVDYSITGMGLFNLHIKDYLLLQKIKGCIDNNIACYVDYGFKK